MMRILGLVAALLLSTAVFAQIPAGTVIPVMLKSTINAGKDKAGQKIEGKVMQDLTLASAARIGSGATVLGHIVSSSNEKGSGSTVVLKFDSIQDHGFNMPLNAGLLAVASMQSVAQAQTPINNSADTQSSNDWTTRQVGGDVVNRARGLAGSSTGVRGTWLEGSSVVMKLTPNPNAGCPGDGPGYGQPQALWVFSSGACGTYDLGNIDITATGNIVPLGEITLRSDRNLLIRGGSGWLLITVAAK